jgi:5-methylcytosine-specific restriction endonuclease McrA
MLKQRRKSSLRVARISFSCVGCGTTRDVLPSYFARLSGRHCSQKCAGGARQRPDSYHDLICPQCGVQFRKRADHLRDVNFCSRKCASASRSARVTIWGKTADLEARRAYHRAYQAANREKINALAVAWGKRNRSARNRLQQQRRAGGKISQADWDAIIERHGGRCVLCGTTERLERDHIIPAARGGLTVVENLQPLCRTCNAGKGTKLMKAVHNIDVEEV